MGCNAPTPDSRIQFEFSANSVPGLFCVHPIFMRWNFFYILWIGHPSILIIFSSSLYLPRVDLPKLDPSNVVIDSHVWEVVCCYFVARIGCSRHFPVGHCWSIFSEHLICEHFLYFYFNVVSTTILILAQISPRHPAADVPVSVAHASLADNSTDPSTSSSNAVSLPAPRWYYYTIPITIDQIPVQVHLHRYLFSYSFCTHHYSSNINLNPCGRNCSEAEFLLSRIIRGSVRFFQIWCVFFPLVSVRPVIVSSAFFSASTTITSDRLFLWPGFSHKMIEAYRVIIPAYKLWCIKKQHLSRSSFFCAK